jgi:hypothetical protein
MVKSLTLLDTDPILLSSKLNADFLVQQTGWR